MLQKLITLKIYARKINMFDKQNIILQYLLQNKLNKIPFQLKTLMTIMVQNQIKTNK